MNLIDWASELDHCIYDDSVGIKIAKLVGNSEFSTYITVIFPGKSVNPHYHKNGDEYYHILSGTGEVTLINISNDEKEVITVHMNNSFVVPENTLHQLKNIGSEPLKLMFSCPENHLKNDRYFL